MEDKKWNNLHCENGLHDIQVYIYMIYFRENRIASIGLCVVNTSRRGYPPEDGAHIALRKS